MPPCLQAPRERWLEITENPGRRSSFGALGTGPGGAVVSPSQGANRTRIARVRAITMDCRAFFRAMVRVCLANALIVVDAFHLHRRVHQALAEVRRGAAGA